MDGADFKTIQVLAHDQVHEAFMLDPIGKGQVFLVSEPEAMFRSWIHDGANPQEFKVGASLSGFSRDHNTN